MTHPHPIDPKTAIALRRVIIVGAVVAIVAVVAMVAGLWLALT